jgi:uncharacterized secreted protein with C-terminal beta-propeller domain
MTRMLGAVLVVAAAALALLDAQAVPPAGAKPSARPPALHSMRSCPHLRSFLQRHGTTQPPIAVGIAVEGDASAPAQGGADSSAAGSPTNLQEVGVDEPDIVKTAGDTILTADGSTLRAVDANGGAPARLDSIELPDGPDSSPVAEYELLVSGDRLLAIGASYGYGPVGGTGAEGALVPDVGYPGDPRTVLAEVDISDPSALRIARTMTIEGSYVSARLTGTTVRLASSSYPALPAAKTGHARAMLPNFTLTRGRTGAWRQGKLVGCRGVDRPSRFAGTGMLSVLTIDLRRGLPGVDADTVLTDGQIVYGSPASLYVATERWSDPGDGWNSHASTEIHRFDTSAADETEYVASGQVTGYMLSQWSMSEHDGLLRVASTAAPVWAEDGSERTESESFVTVLATDGDRLRHVGRLGGLGPGEDIYAVRFIGDAGYVVTFRQIDPLHVIDLRDPTAPRAVGELKIPGYSAYLHPVGPGLLLGVGREASSDGVVGGVQASLFDVSDPAHPTRLDRESFGRGSSSEVEYDHHAFSWLADHSLALLPIDSYTAGGEENGFVGLRVTAGSADPLGRVAKPATAGQVRRTLELDGRVHAVGPGGIGVYDPVTLTRLATLDY